MRIRTMTALLTCLLAVLSTPAEAGSRHEYGKGHGYARSNSAHHRAPYRPARVYRHGYRHGHHHRHHHDALTLAAGAVILGSLVTTLNRPSPAGVRVSGPAWAVSRPYRQQQNVWYQRDAYGDCFEVQLLNNGQQLWTLSHPGNCR